jgi:hypothetical protein
MNNSDTVLFRLVASLRGDIKARAQSIGLISLSLFLPCKIVNDQLTRHLGEPILQLFEFLK